MSNSVLLVQRTDCGEYRTLVAQLPLEDLTEVCAAVMRSMQEAGVNIGRAAGLARDAELLRDPYSVASPIVITGGVG